ncbi:MAG: DUF3703 domain-containing protein [Proteobacteria bacterium]|nr:DUF3703 domain-containing protein [Pseudomonadota bacterium]
MSTQEELEEEHRRIHDRPLLHARVHWRWFRLRIQERRWGAALWEIVALTFSVPTSLVERWFGLRRPGI